MLRTRLILSALPLAVALLALGGYVTLLLSRVTGSVDRAVTDNYKGILAAQDMAAALAAMEKDLWARQSSAVSFQGQRTLFENNLARELKPPLSPTLEHLNQQLVLDYGTFQQAATRLVGAGGTAMATQTDREAVEIQIPRINRALGEIREQRYQAVLATVRAGQITAHNASRLLGVGMIAVALLGLCTAYQLGRSILRPILLLTQATRELSQGQASQPVPVLYHDEVGELASAFNRMAVQLEAYRRSTSDEILRLHRTMEATLASFPDPIFVLNREGQIELKNPAADLLAPGLELNEPLPEPWRGLSEKALSSGANFLPHTFEEAIFLRVHGVERFYLPRILAMRGRDDSLFGVAVVLYDVTRFRLLDAAKTNLVGTVSHELKTPLTSVRMVLHILLERTVGPLTTKQEELLTAARNDAERLGRILNDLLDLARLEGGGQALRRESVAPGALLKTVVEELSPKAASRGVRVATAIERDLPLVSVDRQRINHVFANLLTNAINHSPLGGQILLRASHGSDGYVEFSVHDEGPGIAKEYQNRIFDRFFRVPGQGNGGGAGLGLSIAREITVVHGGHISVQSAPGQGSSFIVSLEAVNGVAVALENGSDS